MARCPECRAEVDAIADLFAAFESLEQPEMPQDVAIRIEAALAREATARTSSASSDVVVGRPAAGEPGKRRRWGRSRALGWSLASLAVLAGGVTLALSLHSSSGSAGSTAASGGAASSARAFARPRAEGSLATPGSVAPNSALAVWVGQTLATEKPEASVNSPCLSDPRFEGMQRLAVRDGSYGGTPATLVVYAHEGTPATVLSVVYAKPCDSATYQVLAEGLVAR